MDTPSPDDHPAPAEQLDAASVVDEPQQLWEILPGVLDAMEAVASAEGDPALVATGFQDLDELLGGGLHPGTLIVVAARPAIGTSTLLNDFCRSAALRQDLPTFLINYESLQKDIVWRLLSAEARIPLHSIRNGKMTDENWCRIAKVMKQVAEAPLHIATPADWTVTQMCEQITRLHAEHQTRLVTVDSLHLMRADVRSDTREREVTEATSALKRLAMRLGIPIVVTAQVNRQPEARPDRAPWLCTDLRDSGAVAHIADVVILLHREDAYVRESPRAGEADLIVAKHRHGPAAMVTVAFQGHYSRFVDMKMP
ncbi:DnaB-like helicase C-terminal domain-containing protein [Streptosporangium sp. DT93]|uniref:DnaB-like helicase C-terminal domain-containing protein n=1 Tax=Streptosporangium sp. DT93 TaxID=3393428 RepID=UPI003CF9E2E9